jgi:16S rRNA (guanine527-N7)-methyltransferase
VFTAGDGSVTPRELLITGAHELGLDISIEQVNSLFLLLTELGKWNRKINLTAIRNERDLIIKHVLDSLSHIKGFNPSPGLRLIDLGSGAGFPAIPMKIILPDISVTLVESVKKKASFLRHIVRTLALTRVEVVDKRAEDLSESHQAAYDVVTARAFANMNLALATGRPFLKPGKHAVLSRGPEETISGQELANVGFVLKNRVELTLPHSDYRRVIWILERTA